MRFKLIIAFAPFLIVCECTQQRWRWRLPLVPNCVLLFNQLLFVGRAGRREQVTAKISEEPARQAPSTETSLG